MSETKWKGRNFLLTLNQIENFSIVKEYLLHFKNFNYAIATKEISPKTGHKHIHIYCQFVIPTTLYGDKLAGCHIDICRGSAQQNIAYIKKKNDPKNKGEIIWEEGVPKYKGGCSIKEVENMEREERRNLPLIYYKSVEQINSKEAAHINVDTLFKEIEVRYIYGGSGLGKTYFASQWIKELNFTTVDVICFANGFWNGVTDTGSFALFDEFRDVCVPGIEFIKLIDYTVKILNVKGGAVKNNYRYIAITSIQDPRYIYEKEWEEKKQWLRRIKVYHFYNYAEYEIIDSDKLFN